MVNLVAADTSKIRIVSDFPSSYQVMEDLRIPVAKDVHLSARMWLPESAEENPVPAVIEYIPFRHRDFTAPRDAVIHPWFAGHGYASIRLEPRGSQESDDIPMDEYVEQEQLDAVAALAWIAKQPWCSGNTGMFGMSWGAFSALQVAAHRPESLRAIIPVHGTDDRFRDDIHFKGGCLLSANLSWSWVYTNYMMRPPDPLLAGEAWRDIWKTRIETAPFVFRDWVGHQSRDAYWRHGSVCEDYGRIEAATYVFCGLSDGYRNAAVRLAENITAPKRVVIGPWAHTYPHIANPGPQFGFLQEATRWWDRWLKGVDNGIDREPSVSIWVQNSAPPRHSYTERDGRWISEEAWPSKTTEHERLYLDKNMLAPEPVAFQHEQEVRTPLVAGMTDGEWLPHGVGPEMPLDQRLEDVGSLVFSTPVLERPLEIVGQPKLAVRVKADQAQGLLQARLIDMRPNGEATRISYGLLNLAHRDGLDNPKPVRPGEWMDVEIELDFVSQHIPANHRLQLSLSTTAFPLVWPSPHSTTQTVQLGERSYLALPIRPKGSSDGDVPAFGGAAIPPPLDLTWKRPVDRTRTITHDVVSNETRRLYVKDDGCFVNNEHGMVLDVVATLAYSCIDDDPLSAKAELGVTIKNSRDTWSTSLDGRLIMTLHLNSFHVDASIEASDGDKPFAKRTFDEVIPRQFC